MILRTDYNHIPESLLEYFSKITPGSEIDCFNLIENRLLLKNKEGYAGAFSYPVLRSVAGCKVKNNRLELGSFKWGFPTSNDRSPLFLANGNEIIAISQYDYSGAD